MSEHAGIQRVYQCRRADAEMRIDGRTDESCWETAEIIELVLPVSLQMPVSRTQARMLYDNAFLYVGFRAYDKDIWSYYTERDSKTCGEDCLEVFVKTHPELEPYYNFEINALGTVYDAYNVKRRAGGDDGNHRWKLWDCEGLMVGISIQGTLNDCSDEDEYWQMELAIPFAGLPTLGERTFCR